MRAIYLAFSVPAIILASAVDASVVIDNITGGSSTGTFASQAGIAGMVDDLELDGLAGGNGTALTQVQAVFGFGGTGMPTGFRVNVFSFNPAVLASQENGDIYSQVFLRNPGAGPVTLSPYPLANAGDGLFPAGSFLVNIDLAGANPILMPGPYYFSIVAVGGPVGSEAFVFGSNMATVGTLDDALHVQYAGAPPFPILATNTNAAYRVFTEAVPSPGAAALLGLAGLMTAKRRRRA